MTTVRFSFVKSNASHEDLLLEIGDWTHISDSYYFWLDKEPEARRGNAHDSIRKMLSIWMEAIVSRDFPIYLLFALDDQSSSWLKVKTIGGLLSITPSWSTEEGYGIRPSDFDPKREPTELSALVNSPITMSQEALLKGIVASIEAL